MLLWIANVINIFYKNFLCKIIFPLKKLTGSVTREWIFCDRLWSLHHGMFDHSMQQNQSFFKR